MLSSASARPTWLDCQRSAVLLPHFHSVLTAKNLKFRSHTSALPWLPKTWSSASRSALTAKDLKFRFRSVFTAKDLKFHVRSFILHWLPKMWSSFPHPLCIDCQLCEVLIPHFRSALTGKNQFRFRISSLPGLPKICSFASALSLNLDCQRSEDRFQH